MPLITHDPNHLNNPDSSAKAELGELRGAWEEERRRRVVFADEDVQKEAARLRNEADCLRAARAVSHCMLMVARVMRVKYLVDYYSDYNFYTFAAFDFRLHVED
jgi:hypothetical protein